MKDKKTNKIINIIMVIIIVLLIILTVLNIIIWKKNKPVEDNIQISHSEQINFDTIEAELIKPQFSIYVFSKYNGQYSQNEIVKAINKLSLDLIPKYYSTFKGKSDDEIHKYYIQQNYISLGKITNIEKTNVGIKNEDTFIKMINDIKKLQGNSLIFTSFKFEKHSITNESDGVKATISIQYELNTELELNLLIRNNKDDNGIIIEVCE